MEFKKNTLQYETEENDNKMLAQVGCMTFMAIGMFALWIVVGGLV